MDCCLLATGTTRHSIAEPSLPPTVSRRSGAASRVLKGDRGEPDGEEEEEGVRVRIIPYGVLLCMQDEMISLQDI